MRQFLELVRENKALRETGGGGHRAPPTRILSLARAGMDDEALNVAHDGPEAGGLSGGVGTRNVMSVDIPVFEYKTRTARRERHLSPTASPSPPPTWTARCKSLSDVLPDLLRLAEVEKSCQLMAAEIEKTRRRVNALEHVDDPRTAGEHQVHHHEAGRERAQHPDPPDEGQGHDARGSATTTRSTRARPIPNPKPQKGPP